MVGKGRALDVDGDGRLSVGGCVYVYGVWVEYAVKLDVLSVLSE